MLNPLSSRVMYSSGGKYVLTYFPLLYCLGWILIAVCVVFYALSIYGVPYCAALAVNQRECKIGDVWDSFKSHFLKLVFLGLFVMIYFFILYLLNNIVWKLITAMIGDFNGYSFWWTVCLGLLILLFGVPITLSPYGLIFQKMGVFQSFLNGFRVFSSDKLTFIAISSAPYIGVIVGGIIAVLSLALFGQAISYESYNSMRTAAPIQLLSNLSSFFISPICATAIASRYFKLCPLQDRSS